MTSMPATSGHSAASCTLPPVVADNYQGKGTYETIDNLKTCKPVIPLPLLPPTPLFPLPAPGP